MCLSVCGFVHLSVGPVEAGGFGSTQSTGSSELCGVGAEQCPPLCVLSH